MKRFACLAVLALAGCASESKLERPRVDIGLVDQAETEAPMRGPGVGIEKSPDAPRVSEEDIRLALQELGPLDGPVRIAVVEIAPAWPGYAPQPVAPEHVEAFRESLKGSADSVVAIPQMFLPRQADLPSLRYAAARVGANALFVFGRAADSDTYFNGWSNLNWLVVPIFAVPGKTVEVYAAAEGAMIDVATSRVRAVAAADVRLDTHITTAASSWRPRTELDREARLESLKALGEGLAREIGALRVGQK